MTRSLGRTAGPRLSRLLDLLLGPALAVIISGYVVAAGAAAAAAATTAPDSDPVQVSGLVHRKVYLDRVTFTVSPAAGRSCTARLNGEPAAVGTPIDVTVMDHYELDVTCSGPGTAEGGATPFHRQWQFIVLSSDRGRPETGLRQWTPLPPIPSAAAEFAGATFEIIHPARLPAGIDLPMIARLRNSDGHGRRANGTVEFTVEPVRSAPGVIDWESFRVLRGVGFGLHATRGTGHAAWKATVGSLTKTGAVIVEPAESVTWTQVEGLLEPRTVWPANARIAVHGHLTVPAGGRLEIGPGVVVRLQPGVNITNLGRIQLNGTLSEPILFTATNRVAPERHAGAWGGFLARGRGSVLAGTGAIFTGSGGDARFTFARGTSHRREQALFQAQAGARVLLTNCFIINNAGQIGNGQEADFTFDHCLLQRAITAGEYVGGRIEIEHSALVEFPAIDDHYGAAVADGDYDAIYFTTGVHRLRHSLFAWAKDDAIDSGTGGAGTVVVTNCWIEAAWHEALAWSGGERETWTVDTVVLNSGQGLECGWSSGDNSPLCVGDRLLLLGNGVGARYGDNYEGTTRLGSKRGFLWLTNSVVLHNQRDVWGRVWDDTWNYRTNAMDVRSNWLTAPHPVHPANRTWNPRQDGDRLRPFLRTPVDQGVGLGIATWTNALPRSALASVPIALSSFSPLPVQVSFTLSSDDAVVTNGTVTLHPGQLSSRLNLTPAVGETSGATGSRKGRLTLRLSQPVQAELTGRREVTFGP